MYSSRIVRNVKMHVIRFHTLKIKLEILCIHQMYFVKLDNTTSSIEIIEVEFCLKPKI